MSPVIQRINGPAEVQAKAKVDKSAQKAKSRNFDQLLQQQLQNASGAKFSAHAMDRIDKRHIHFDASEAEKVGKAMREAETKGARDSLFIGNGYALIVNIPNKTVVTAMDTGKMEKSVVTNIDSTVIVR